MTLVVQVGGVLVLGALLGLLMRGDAVRTTARGVTALAVAVAGLAFWGGVWSTGRMFIEQTATYPSIHEANVTAGSLFPANVNLLTAAELAIPRNARVFLLTTPGAVGDSAEWISYQLSPRAFVSSIQEAQYVLVYGGSPKTVSELARFPIVLDRTDGGVVRTKPA